jgi:hypothetical protein
MATSMTFNTLVDDLQTYLERGDPSDTTVFDQLPRLINLAEREIAQRLKILGFVTPMISGLIAGTPVYQKPDRWRRTVSMNYAVATAANPTQNTRVPIYARSLEYCQRYWPDQTATAPPKFVADYDYQHWLIVPTPDLNYPWAINAWLMPALLDVTNQTNWLTEFAPNVLLYRALLEATPFLKNDERIPVWERMYEEQIAGLNGQDIQRIIDRAGVRKED